MDVSLHGPSRQVWLAVTVASFAVLAALTWRTPQTLYSDPAFQLRALQQYRDGMSNTINHLTSPDPKDLSQDVQEWYSWWPPSPQIAVSPWLALGMSMGNAVRLVVLECILVGSVGWVFWMGLFRLPALARWGIALMLPWSHYVANNLFYFSADLFAFAAAPWIFWTAHRAVDQYKNSRTVSGTTRVTSALLGLFLGCAFVLKYSLVFAAFAALIYMVLEGSKRWYWPAIIGCAIPVAALNGINHWFSQDMNPVVATAGFHWEWWSVYWISSLPSLALTDAFGLLSYVFLHPTHGLWRQDEILGMFGLPGSLLMAWLLYRQRGEKGASRLAIVGLLTAMGSMMIVWNYSQVANYNARFLEVFSIACLPILIQESARVWNSGARRGVRVGLATAGLLYVVLPLMYGIASVAAKCHTWPNDYRYGPSHLYNQALATHDLSSVLENLLADARPEMDIWYLSDPLMALDIPGRALIEFADFDDIEHLRKLHYQTSVPKRVRALLPPRFEESEKGAVIRASFRHAGPWSRRSIPGSSYDLWEAPMAARPQTVGSGI